MKKVFLLVFMISAMLTKGNTVNSELLISLITSEKKFVLNASSNKYDQVKCSIISASDDILYSQHFKTNVEQPRTFDLSYLPKGEYTVIIENNISVHKYEVLVDRKNLQLRKAPKVLYKPFIHQNNDKFVDLNHLSLGETVKINIYGPEGPVYKDVIKAQKSISKRFNLTKAPQGNYTVEVVVGGQSFFKYIRI